MKVTIWLATYAVEKEAFREAVKNWFSYLELYEINYKVKGNGTTRRMIVKLDDNDVRFLTGLPELTWAVK